MGPPDNVFGTVNKDGTIENEAHLRGLRKWVSCPTKESSKHASSTPTPSYIAIRLAVCIRHHVSDSPSQSRQAITETANSEIATADALPGERERERAQKIHGAVLEEL